MSILAIIFAFVGGACLWLAIGLTSTGSLRMHIENMTPTQLQVFLLAGAGVLLLAWAITITLFKSK